MGPKVGDLIGSLHGMQLPSVCEFSEKSTADQQNGPADRDRASATGTRIEGICVEGGGASPPVPARGSGGALRASIPDFPVGSGVSPFKVILFKYLHRKFRALEKSNSSCRKDQRGVQSGNGLCSCDLLGDPYSFSCCC